MQAGGYHMDTFGKCIATSLALFIVFGAIAQYTYKLWKIEYILVFLIISVGYSVVASAFWAPSDNPNRPITKIAEIRKFKILTFVHIFIVSSLIILIIFLKTNKYQMYAISAIFGLIIEIFTITPLGHAFFDKISGNLKVKKRILTK
jgi:accessory gene regulator B